MYLKQANLSKLGIKKPLRFYSGGGWRLLLTLARVGRVMTIVIMKAKHTMMAKPTITVLTPGLAPKKSRIAGRKAVPKIDPKIASVPSTTFKLLDNVLSFR